VISALICDSAEITHFSVLDESLGSNGGVRHVTIEHLVPNQIRRFIGICRISWLVSGCY
jgi:hypothetical protein